MKKTNTKEKTNTTRADIGHLLDEMRDLKVKLAFALANRDKAVQVVVARYADDITDIEGELLAMDAVVCRWATDNRDAEFGEEKTLSFASGCQVQFRQSPKALDLDYGWTDADVIAALEKADLRKYIRTEQKLDRAALIKDVGEQLTPKLAKKFGIVVTQAETVAVKIPMATAGKESK